jgi:cell division septum initiation protein DivIVA
MDRAAAGVMESLQHAQHVLQGRQEEQQANVGSEDNLLYQAPYEAHMSFLTLWIAGRNLERDTYREREMYNHQWRGRHPTIDLDGLLAEARALNAELERARQTMRVYAARFREYVRGDTTADAVIQLIPLVQYDMGRVSEHLNGVRRYR